MEDVYCVVTFHVTQHALLFEKVMKEFKYPIKLMPVPRQVSSSCGIAAKIPCDKKEEILTLCKEKNLSFDEFHEIKHKNKKSWF